jgi:hypothetical protein
MNLRKDANEIGVAFFLIFLCKKGKEKRGNA